MVFNLGLIGYPLGHSLSPKIHRAALDSCGLKGDYSLYLIHPEDYQGLKNLLARVRSGQITGLNVTIPHKQSVIPLLDGLTLTAQAIGAVNTISLKNGQLIGENTDAPGFLADLRKFFCATDFGSLSSRLHDENPLQKTSEVFKNALVLGAGGSARAVVYALAYDGWNIKIASRRPEQAQTLIEQVSSLDFPISRVEYHPTALQSLIPTLSLIVNTTPLGMTPNGDASPWPDNLPFPPYAAVYDLVYNPRETKLVDAACKAGLPATTGLGMLIEQAALSFEIWTGYIPQRDVLWKTVDSKS